MALSRRELTELVRTQLQPGWAKEKERLDRIDRWYRWDHEDFRLPKAATIEHQRLREMSKVPWLGLVVTSTAQCLFVDGFRSENDTPQGGTASSAPRSGPWRIWQANYMDQRQIALHRATLAYGYAFATVLPGTDFQGEDMPVIRGVSPRKMYAVYDDIAEDDWPQYAMRVLASSETELKAKIFDDTLVYTVRVPSNPLDEARAVEIQNVEEHGAGVCPVVRYCNELDLDGRTPGEVEPHIPLAARINKTSYDRMLVQHFNSWKVRYIAGLSQPDTDEAANVAALQLRVQDLLVSEDPDTKFGTLDETGLKGFIDAHQADVETLAAVTQTPTHELTGQMANLSAEALAAARASLTQKVYERQKSIGRSHVQTLRLASSIAGDEAHAEDVTGRVTWQDTSIRSMAQAVDALGKAAQMLQIPATELWGRIPGVERSDVEEWKRVAERDDPINRMQAELARQATPQRLSAAPAPGPGVPAA
jgi:hypothetical protein